MLDFIFKLFRKEKSESVKQQNDAAKQIQSEEKNALLANIYFQLRNGLYLKAMGNIINYQSMYGKLNGNEMFSFNDSFFDGSLPCVRVSSSKLLSNQAPSAKAFFEKCVDGKISVSEVKELEEQYVLQQKLLFAWGRRDIILFDELVRKGAKVDHVYQGANWEGQFTLWNRIAPSSAKDFYKYFVKNFRHLPEVKSHLEKEEHKAKILS